MALLKFEKTNQLIEEIKDREDGIKKRKNILYKKAIGGQIDSSEYDESIVINESVTIESEEQNLGYTEVEIKNKESGSNKKKVELEDNSDIKVDSLTDSSQEFVNIKEKIKSKKMLISIIEAYIVGRTKTIIKKLNDAINDTKIMYAIKQFKDKFTDFTTRNFQDIVSFFKLINKQNIKNIFKIFINIMFRNDVKKEYSLKFKTLISIFFAIKKYFKFNLIYENKKLNLNMIITITGILVGIVGIYVGVV